MNFSDPFKILAPSERWLPILSEYTYNPVYVKQERWEDVKVNLNSFADLFQVFETA